MVLVGALLLCHSLAASLFILSMHSQHSRRASRLEELRRTSHRLSRAGDEPHGGAAKAGARLQVRAQWHSRCDRVMLGLV